MELIATSPHRAVGVRGYAGTGKIHMLDSKGLAREHGHRVVALAPYGGSRPRAPRFRVEAKRGERARTIVVAGTNEARREINRAVREDPGFPGRAHEFATLTRRDTTGAERAFSNNCTPGAPPQSRPEGVADGRAGR